MDDFDIEAYLEAQVDGAKAPAIADATSSAQTKEVDRDKKESDRSDRRERSSSRRRHRSSDRHSSRDRDRRRNSRSRSTSRHRKKSSRRHRSRSADRDRKHRRRDRSRDRSSERSRHRSREKSSSRSRAAEVIPAPPPEPVVAPPPSREEAARLLAERDAARKQKEIDDLTKDQRTVFVSQLTMKVTEKMVKSFFENVGRVNGVIMIRDKFTGKHKGFAYVEMGELESIPNCLLLNGIVPDFQKFPILVKASEAEKNFVARKENPSIYEEPEAKDTRMYIGNLHVNITEEDLKVVLKPFGSIESIHINRDDVGTSKGYGFVRFARSEDAHRARNKLSGLELAGRTIKIGFVNDGAMSSGSGWKLEDDDGVQMNSQSRVMLMAKLSMNAGIAPAVPKEQAPPSQSSSQSSAPPQQPKAPAVTGFPSQCFVIKNMFVLEEETEPNWQSDIAEDVKDECRKYGEVQHIHIEDKETGGLVYLKFDTVQAAVQAATSLNGRWFAGRMITANYINPTVYGSKFGV